LQQAEKNHRDTMLRAPYEGLISGRWVEPSQLVGARQRVFEIHGRDDVFEVQFQIPEHLVSGVQLGSAHRLHIPSLGLSNVSATLYEVSAQSDRTNSFSAVLRAEHKGLNIRAGLTAQIDFQYQSTAFSERAAWHLPGGSFVMVGQNSVQVLRFVKSRHTLEAVHLKVHSLSSEGVIVSGNLSTQDVLVRKGLAFLRAGQTVSLLSTEQQRYNP
jgi:hypothetical protein